MAKTISKRNQPLRTPITWVGGKGQNYKNILGCFPLHTRYAEVFGGGLSILFNKEECEFEVVNDLHDNLINFYRVLRDPVMFFSFYRKVHWSLYSRKEFYEMRKAYKDVSDPVERAFQFYCLARQSFAGCIAMDRTPAWGFTSNSIKAKCSHAWDNMRNMLPLIHKRLRRVQIENLDFRKFFSTYTHPDILQYIDPPYSFNSSRNKRERYLYEFTEKDHQDLLDLIKERDQFIVLSGYENEQYEILLDYGWKCFTFPYKLKCAGNYGQKSRESRSVNECVWVNSRVIRSLERMA